MKLKKLLKNFSSEMKDKRYIEIFVNDDSLYHGLVSAIPDYLMDRKVISWCPMLDVLYGRVNNSCAEDSNSVDISMIISVSVEGI